MKNEIRYKTITSEGMGQTAQNLDEFLASGYYLLELTHGAGKLGLPIEDCANRHYMVAHLLVSDSGTAATLQKERRVGQTLVLTNSNNGATRVYTRTALLSKDGAAWSSWTDLGAAVTSDIQDGAITVEKLSTAVREKVDNPLRPLFIAAGAEYNDSDIAIEKDTPWGEKILHLPGCYHFNHIGDLTDEDLTYIISNQSIVYNLNIPRLRQKDNKLRTFLPIFNNQGVGSLASISHSTFSLCDNLEVVKFTTRVVLENIDPERYRTAGSYMFYNCSKLKYIQPLQLTATTTILGMFEGCKSLIEVEIYNLAGSISFLDSNLINKKTILCAIQNATPTSAITITLHPNAYARLANDADIVAALQAQPLVTLVSA